ncbi:hypothetical protein CLV44_10186 [Marinobacterium halophilum]|uniref:Uncharacterized protein n=1 Tax=Marinobacterium halophilum TaxID=267374 RepID=A0A2P8F4P5_9GAMM|nr:hypothetical protein [Marinobacterium halophilum]PSL16688.1 hypothetical protein CLV44_10186 [Marinobacterium halophilum]
MPSRSIRESISRFRRKGLLLAWLSGACVATTVLAEEAIPYGVTAVDSYAAGRGHGRDAYEGLERGDRDRELMREVPFADHQQPPPQVWVVHPSAPPPVFQVEVRAEPVVALKGEDKVFDQIRLDIDIQRCVFQNICTDEVKAIPGVYLGDEQSGDADWTGRSDGLEVITENEPAVTPSAPILQPGNGAPGRVFVEEPASAP